MAERDCPQYDAEEEGIVTAAVEKPTGPIVFGKFPCVVCGVVRKTALGAWACWRLHQIHRAEQLMLYSIRYSQPREMQS